MFLLSKIADLLTQPLHWVVLLLLLSVAFNWIRPTRPRPRQAARLAALALALLLALGIQAVPDCLLGRLETTYTEIAPDADTSGYDGVIILGGALESGRLSSHHRQPQLNASAERMTSAVALWQHNPRLQLLFTGGEGMLVAEGPPEAERARAFFTSMGIPAHAVRYEERSRTTYENAVLTAQLPGVNIRQRWLLVTSAWHMPRAMGAFVKAGWNVTAYPVDFRTGGPTPWNVYSIADGADHWYTALHELLGMAGYRLRGAL